jgi:CHASE3 domain sensor protein
MMNSASLKRKSARNLIAIYLAMLVFAVVGGGVSLVALTKVAAADQQLYAVGVDSLHAIAMVRDEFAWCPINARNAVIETDPSEIRAIIALFQTRKKKTQEIYGKIGAIVRGDAENERLHSELTAHFEKYWSAVERIFDTALANRNKEAVELMKHVGFPQFRKTNEALQTLQDKIKDDADRQFRSNKRLANRASAAMTACTVLMVLSAVLFALYVEKLTRTED